MPEVSARKDFEAIYSQSFRAVYSVCYALLVSREDAEETAQDAFTAFYKKNQKFPSVDDAKYHLMRNAKNLSFNLLKHRNVEKRNRIKLAESEKNRRGSQDDSFSRDDILRFIGAALKSDMLREVFVLRVFSSLSYEEIASTLSIPLAAVKARLYRARLIVKEEFEKGHLV